MGNRAVITTKSGWLCKENHLGVYLHWNGGRDSIEAFLRYCEMQGYPSPEQDNYGWARLCQVIGNYFGGSYSVGIDIVSRLDCDNGDNGTYIIDRWKIVGRKYFQYKTEQNNYDLKEMLWEIDESMPEKCRIGSEKIHEFLQKEAKENHIAV